MTARELLTQLKTRGVEIKPNGDRLVMDAPKGTITPELRTALSKNKADLLTILNAPAVEEKPAAVAETLLPPSILAREKLPKLTEKEPAPSSVAEEIKTLENELARLRKEEEARRPETGSARLAGERGF